MPLHIGEWQKKNFAKNDYHYILDWNYILVKCYILRFYYYKCMFALQKNPGAAEF